MMIVVLNQNCIINGIPRVKGEVVQVPSDFDRKLIKRIIKVIAPPNATTT